MDVERTIEFLLKNQVRMDARMNAKFAKADARFAKAERRLDRIERVVAQNNRIVIRLVRYGVSLRSDVRRIDKAWRRSPRGKRGLRRSWRRPTRS